MGRRNIYYATQLKNKTRKGHQRKTDNPNSEEIYQAARENAQKDGRAETTPKKPGFGTTKNNKDRTNNKDGGRRNNRNAHTGTANTGKSMGNSGR